MLSAVEHRLAPGDLVLTGSIVQVPVAPGEVIAGEVSGLGRVSLRLAR